MLLLLPSCFQVTQNISEALESELPPVRKAQTILHLAMCRHCRLFRTELHFLHAAFSQYQDHLPDGHLSEKSRREIVKRLAASPFHPKGWWGEAAREPSRRSGLSR